MAGTRWTHTRGWLLTALVSNLASSVLGLLADEAGEPAWLQVVRAVLLVVALVSIVVYIVKLTRRRVPEDMDADRTDQ